MYSTILIDSDNTLLDFDKSERVAFGRAFEEAGFTCTDEIYEKYSAINDSLWHQLEKDEISSVDEVTVLRFGNLFDFYNISYDANKMNSLYFDALSECSFIIDGADTFLCKLSEKYAVYLITNGIPKIQRSRIEKSSLKKYLKDIFISGEIGYTKPDKRYFDYVYNRITEKDKNKIIVIGDGISSDIKGANNFGLDSVWFNPKKKTQNGILPTYTCENYDGILEILK